MPEQDVSVSANIAAPAETLYDLVSDVTRMGEWSPENVGGRWLGGATAPVVGARFRGSNRRGWRRWSTTCTVVEAEPGRTFAFEVSVAGIPASRWTYEFRPDGDTTLVTETWADRRPRWFALLARVTMGIDDIRAHNQENSRATLANLAARTPTPGLGPSVGIGAATRPDDVDILERCSDATAMSCTAGDYGSRRMNSCMPGTVNARRPRSGA